MSGALEGIRVLELCRVPPAEVPGMMLGDLGADVIKIATPTAGDAADIDARQAVHDYTNRNKRSVMIDMKTAEGGELFRSLAFDADVVIEGFRPGVMRRLGADYPTLAERNPRLVYCSMSGYGQDGPCRDRPAHDLNFIAQAGLLSLVGEAGRIPAIPLNLVADLGGAAMHAAFAIMTALFGRARSGRGQYIDVSYLDATIALMAATPNLRRVFVDGQVARQGEGVLSGGYPYYTVYECRDGKRLSVACSEPWLWANLCGAIGRTDLARFARQPGHYRRRPLPDEQAARESVQAVFAERDRDDWLRMLADAGACVAPVLDVLETISDPQVRHREMVRDVAHPVHGVVRQFGPAVRYSETPAGIRTAAPLPGEHTDEVLRALGLGDEAIRALRAAGVVA